MSQQASNNGQGIIVQGRIVWTTGKTLFEGKVKTDQNTRQPIIDNKTGQPVIEFGFGLAIPKIDPRTGQFTQGYTEIWQKMQQEALSLYPSGQIPPAFAMKFKDGDTGIDQNGVSYSVREGYAGHIVVACTTRIAPKFFKHDGVNNIMVNDGIKCGDYVNVQLNIKAHPAVGQGKPGLYMNPSGVQFIQAGKEIVNTPSGDQVFGMSAPAYNGQVVADVAPQMPNMAGMQAPPMGAPMPQQAPMQAPPQQAPAPHYGVLPGQQPQQGYQPGNAPMPGAPAGNGQIPYPQMPSAAPQVQGQPYAPSAFPSNSGMPGMPR